jgi:hypothetical protein
MDVYVVFLRLVHIIAGVFWVGAALLMLGFVSPTVRALGPAGGAFMQRFTKNSRYPVAMGVSSLLTTLAGLLLYWRVSSGFSAEWMQSTSGLVLSIGAVAGIVAFLIGSFIIGPTAGQIGKLGDEMAARQGPPTPEQGATMQRLQAKMERVSRFEAALMLVALVGMAAARYL